MGKTAPLGMTSHSRSAATDDQPAGQSAGPEAVASVKEGASLEQDKAGEPGPGATPPERPGFWSRRRGRRRAALAVGLVFLSIFAVHFGLFAHQIAAISMPADARADGIVVLTGGTDRVERAIALLAEGRAQRLLISGVHPGTTRKQIISLTSADKKLFECCVDLDRLALNTVGNAVETAQWARDHGYRSLLVVTSAYHMPRAELELREMLPQVELVPYPVFSQELHLRKWYMQLRTIKLLMREYVKYTVARIRISLKPVL